MELPHINDRVGEYVLIEQIGTGAFGRVYKACHAVWPERIVAVKIPTDPEYVRLLRREGVVMHQVKHPNVVRPLGCDPQADPPYLVVEYLAGGDLKRLIARGPLPVHQAVRLFEQTLGGLSAAHAAGIVHLDLKPSNILLDEAGSARLTDFGLGRAILLTDESLAQSMSLAAEAASITGTLEYMAPEQRRGEPVDHRADLYAAGIILFEMLTAERPAGGERPGDLRPDVPRWLDELYGKCYARLDRRYASADAALADLRRGWASSFALSPGEVLAESADLPPIAPLDSGALEELNASRDEPPVAAVLPPDDGPAARCPDCGAPIPGGDQFCVRCGRQLTETVRRCPRCGRFPQLADEYCTACGARL